jgi:hypothetical protein
MLPPSHRTGYERYTLSFRHTEFSETEGTTRKGPEFLLHSGPLSTTVGSVLYWQLGLSWLLTVALHA